MRAYKGDVSPFLTLIARLCDFDEAEIDYLIWRLAIKIQNPWMKIPSYVLIVTSDEGTGKSQLVKFIAGLYGAHGKIITDREMESSFDDWKAAGVLFAAAEEVSFKAKRSVANRLKALASMECDHINPKFQPSYAVENFYDLFFTANDPDAIYFATIASAGPSSSCTTRSPQCRRPSATSFRLGMMLVARKRSCTTSCLRPMGGAFDPYAPAPATVGKTEMAEAGRNPAEQFVADLIADAIEDTAACPLQDFTSHPQGVRRRPDAEQRRRSRPRAGLAGSGIAKQALPVRHRTDDPLPHSRYGGVEAGAAQRLDQAISRIPRAAGI